MGLFTLISAAVSHERDCVPRRKTENEEIAKHEEISENSCSVSTSDSIYTLSILGIIELLVGLPMVLFILFFMLARVSNKINSNAVKITDYVLLCISIVVTIGGFIFALYTDATAIDIYNKQKVIEHDTAPKTYIIFFGALIGYYVLCIALFSYINRDNIGTLVRASSGKFMI